ncbi:WecB/TagA/CpsF family glycosyltransferase [Roseobacteraceae bacterium S113]
MRFGFGETVIEVNVPYRAALLQHVTRRFAASEGFALATINLDHLVKLSTSVEFRDAYAAQDFVVADGNPIVWLSRLAGRSVELLPGSELVVPLAQRAVASGVPVGLVGSTDEALAGAAEALKAAAPGLEVVAMISPPMGFDPDSTAADEIFATLSASGARMVFLALGAPKQEIMAARGRLMAPQIGFASVGAGLDFLAGTQKRAPKIVRRLAVEWLWRLATNPKRLFGRYMKCIAIMPGQTKAALRQRREI